MKVNLTDAHGSGSLSGSVSGSLSESLGTAGSALASSGEPLHVRVQLVGPIEVPLPRYQSEHAAGMDLQAALAEPVTLRSLERMIIPTGLAMAIPTGWEGQVRPRSGLAAKRGVTVINAPGTVDSDYRGEIKVALVNLSAEPVTIEPLERIAQIVFARHGTATLEVVSSLDDTARGAGGYGSTGTR